MQFRSDMQGCAAARLACPCLALWGQRVSQVSVWLVTHWSMLGDTSKNPEGEVWMQLLWTHNTNTGSTPLPFPQDTGFLIRFLYFLGSAILGPLLSWSLCNGWLVLNSQAGLFMMKTQQMQKLPFGNHPQFGVPGIDLWMGLRFPSDSQEPAWVGISCELRTCHGGLTWPGARSHVPPPLSHLLPAGPSVAGLGLVHTFHITES